MARQTSPKPMKFKAAFDADDELRQYKASALTIFAMSLHLRLDDIEDFAANAITDGPNDKKIDLCHLDVNENLAVIAQSYLSPTWGKVAAPDNKASDLNTAMVWLLSAKENRIPPHLKTKAIDLRRALANGELKRLEICYVHNCSESPNVENALKATADAARDMVRALVGSDAGVVVAYKEFGLRTIEELYQSRDSEILVDEWIDVPGTKYIKEKGTGWNGILTTVPGEWIQRLHQQHQDRLFSANYRDFLGAVPKTGNINYEITKTADSEPVNFWVYNNGITALTHEVKLTTRKLRIRGISVINGAQTSGALSAAAKKATKKTKVLIRFVECSSRKLIDKIIRYNNTQNEIKPADRRSNDAIQKRLREDFLQQGVSYVHRRSAARTPKKGITAAAMAPALCAFHGSPQISYRNAKEIFNNDDIYNRVFPTNITIEHLFLVRALSNALDRTKMELNAKVSNETATRLEEQQYEVLKYSASKHFVFYVVGDLAEEIMHQKVSDLFEWKCKREIISPDNKSLTNAWIEGLHALLPHMATIVGQHGKDAFYEVPRSEKESRKVSQSLKALIASLESALGPRFDELRQRTSV